MRILVVCSGNQKNFDFKINQAFVYEQIEEISKQFGIDYDTFFIKGKGFHGYIKSWFAFRKLLRIEKYDLIHAHYGLSGALALLQLRIPVITTFHDGETHSFLPNLISSFSALFSAYNIFVAQHIYYLLYFKNRSRSAFIPCGVSYDMIQIIDKQLAMNALNLSSDKKHVLFGGAFDDLRKNYPLLKEAISILNRDNINVIEMKGLSRQTVTMLMCGCDLFVLPSRREGSPQALKEAMLCNCPVVATDVADIKTLISDTEGCYLCSFDPYDVAEKIEKALAYGKRTNGREKLYHLDNLIIAAKVMEVYKRVER